MYFIHKQLIPIDGNQNDPNWAKRQIWVLRLNPNDTIDSFETLAEANSKRDELDEWRTFSSRLHLPVQDNFDPEDPIPG